MLPVGPAQAVDKQRRLVKAALELVAETAGQAIHQGRVETHVHGAVSGLLEQERQQRPVEAEILRERGLQRGRDRLYPVTRALQQAGALLHGRPGGGVHRVTSHGILPQADPQTPIAGTLHQPDLRELRVAVIFFGLGKKVRSVAHAAGHHPLVDQIDRQGSNRRLFAVPATAGLEAHQATAGGGNPDRAATVIGVGDGHCTGGHQRGGTAR